MYCPTFSGVFGSCGISDPAIDASASMNKRIRAVRIERRVRQTSATDSRSVTLRGLEDMATGPILGRCLKIHRPGAYRASGAVSRVHTPAATRTPTVTSTTPETPEIQRQFRL